jgi:hypothetical protein
MEGVEVPDKELYVRLWSGYLCPKKKAWIACGIVLIQLEMPHKRDAIAVSAANSRMLRTSSTPDQGP